MIEMRQWRSAAREKLLMLTIQHEIELVEDLGRADLAKLTKRQLTRVRIFCSQCNDRVAHCVLSLAHLIGVEACVVDEVNDFDPMFAKHPYMGRESRVVCTGAR